MLKYESPTASPLLITQALVGLGYFVSWIPPIRFSLSRRALKRA